MVMFLHALQICAIASISVTIRGFVLITAEVEEFKNLASTFLSPDLADKLTALVAESGLSNKNQQVGENVPHVSFREIENIVKYELFKSYNTPFPTLNKKVTYSPISYNRRYKTVESHDNKQNQTNEHYILRQSDSEKTKLEPLYIQYKRMDDHRYHDENKKLDHAELRLNDRHKIYSQKTTIPKGLFDEIIDQNVTDVNVDDMFKKLDYTETKLGEWNYNPNLFQIPVNIKNAKTGYTYYFGVNNEDTNADIEEPVLEEDNMFTENSFIEVTEKNVMNDKLIGSKTTNKEPLRMEDHGTYNQYFLEPEEEESQENKPEALSMEEINTYETLPIGSKNKDNFVKKNREKQVIERDTFNKHFLGPKYKKIPKEKSKTLLKQYHDMYATRILESENQVSGERQNEFQQETEQEHKNQQILKSIQRKEKKKKPLINEHYMYEKNMSVRNKTKSSNIKTGRDNNEKQFDNLEPSITDKEEKKKPQKQLIEENDMYEKYALNYKTEDSYEIKVSHKGIDDGNKKLEIEKGFSHKSAPPDKRHKSNSNEKLSLKNEKLRFNHKASKFKENSKTDQSIKTLTKVLPENLSDSLSDDREFKPKDVKAKTEYLYEYVEVTSATKDIKAITENVHVNLDDSANIKGYPTKRLKWRGTIIPKRDYYKMSTPDYYNKLPKIVEKYDFEEPIPEQDRERVKEKHVKREPALINKKIRLA